MQNFLSDFGLFMQYTMNSLKTLWEWFSSSILGEIFIFIIIIGLFMFILDLITRANE